MTTATWLDWFINHTSNDAGNRNLQAFSDILSSESNGAEKLRSLVEEIDTVILAANANNNIMIMHSPKNLGGTRSRPDNKVVCMLGMGPQAVSVQVDLNSALADCNIIVPTVQELAECRTAQDVADIPAPNNIGLVGFEGSAIFIPGPVLRDAILNANTTNPSELIPIVSAAARVFDLEHAAETMNGNAVTHGDDLNAWLYGVHIGSITETRYTVLPDDQEISLFSIGRHRDCISRGGGTTPNDPDPVNNVSVLQQLAAAISTQNEEAVESNNLRRNELLRQISRDDEKKNRFKKIHPSILKMVSRAAATSSTDENESIPAGFSRFINQENVGMAQYDLVHQFKEQGFHDVAFASGTTQALYIGEFLFADSSTPSNFTIFAFHEQEPNADNRQQDHLICHLIQVEGQKKTLDEIKASLKQSVHVPTDFNGLGTQIQLFAAAASIFFGEESICTMSLKQLLIVLSRNKKSFRDQIALDNLFVAKLLFAVDKRVQRWLKMCELAHNSRSQVNDNVLNFDDLIDGVLNGTFNLTLPATFKMQQGTTATISGTNGSDEFSGGKEPGGSKEPGGGKGRGNKRKSGDGNGNIVKNSSQVEEFKLLPGETWKDDWASVLPHDRPNWEPKVKTCARFHIKGDCFDNCSRKSSHVTSENFPSDKRAAFSAFMAKCREEKKKSA